MSRLRAVATGLLVGATCAAVVSPASASEMRLGLNPVPSGHNTHFADCSPGPVFYTTPIAGPGYTYAVPPGGGTITEWGTTVGTDALGGAPIALVVLRPATVGKLYTVVGSDERKVPYSVPPSMNLVYTVPTPIQASGGDLIGIYTIGSPETWCGVSSDDFAPARTTLGIAGLNLNNISFPPGRQLEGLLTVPNTMTNVWATVVPTIDASVSGAVLSDSIAPGDVGAYAFTVANNGPGAGGIVFSATVPNGLNVLSATAGAGTCTVSGPCRACLSELRDGAGRWWRPAVPGSLKVSCCWRRPVEAARTLTLTVVAGAASAKLPSAPPACKTIALKGTSLALAKRVIAALNCKLGKVTKAASKSVKKGLVVSTSPGAGKTLANGTKIKVVQSSGPRKKKRHVRAGQ